MKYYQINGRDGSWALVNLHRIIFVEFDDKAGEMVFDNILRIKIDQRDYDFIRKDVLRKMFRRL